MKIENTPEAKARFFALYWGQSVLLDINNRGYHVLYPIERSNMYRIEESVLELTPLSQISDEDAIELARIVLSKDKDYKPIAMIRWGFVTRILINKEPSNSDENTIIEMYIDINFDRNEVSFTWEYHHEKGIGDNPRHLPKAVKVYDYLRSKGYYVGDGTEIEYGWVKLKTT